jgi:tartrate dehydrogenase/decarboxylase/D-malate dehydrogenase
MLDHLGHHRWAGAVQRAIELVVTSTGIRTPDLQGNATTQQVGDAVVAALDQTGDEAAAAPG